MALRKRYTDGLVTDEKMRVVAHSLLRKEIERQTKRFTFFRKCCIIKRNKAENQEKE